MSLVLQACQAGGEATAESISTLSPVFVQAPTVATPTESPYYSDDDSITIGGLCNNGYTVQITGQTLQTMPCQNSQYAFQVTHTTDGFYPFKLTQSHPDTGTSKETVFIWVRKSSITKPTITSPASSPFASGKSVLTLQGGCETGATVIVTGDVGGETECIGSTYNISLVSYDEGDLNINVKQVDQANNSASTDLVWRRHVLRVSPSAPSLAAGSLFFFTPSGGSESYTSQIISNNSGATYTPANHEYLAGTLAGVTDTLRFTDSLGDVVDVNIQVIPGPVDHFQYAIVSGDSQTGDVYNMLPTALRAEVVDQYSNPIPNIPVVFTVLGGDAKIISTPNISTDATGGAEVQVQLGGSHYRNVIGVKPASGVFPDVAATGNALLQFSIFAQSKNSDQLANHLAVSSLPGTILVDDFTANGKMDIAVLNTSAPNIGILEGNGNSLFNTMSTINSVCTGPTSMIDGDFNEDTLNDIIVTCSSSNKISIFLKAADNLSFLAPSEIDVNPIEALPLSITKADIDGDDHLDIITASASGASISLRLGAGDGTFGAPTYFSVGNNPNAIVSADFNQDTRADIAVLNASDNNVSFLINNGLGGFLAQFTFPVGSSPSDLKVGDFNNDNFPDVVAVNNIDDNISVLMNDNFGGFFGPTNFPVGSGPLYVEVADLDGDLNDDLLVSNTGSSTISTLLGLGNGSFFSLSDTPTLMGPGYVKAADINGDSLVDVMVSTNADSKVQVFVGQGNGTIGLETSTESSPSVIRLADLNNDSIEDMVVLQKGTNNISIRTGNGLGIFNLVSTIGTAGGPADVAIADLNGDGEKDLAVVHQDISSLRIYTGVGDGTFTGPSFYPTGLQPVAILARDLDADGDPDLAVIESAANMVSVYQNLGSGVFDNRLSFATGSQPVALEIADVNGDQELDLITANSVPGSVSIILSGGNFTFQPQIEIATNNGSSSLVAGFFNADAFVDIAVANETAGSISILLGQGNGGFTGPNDFFSAVPARGLVALDYDGNNRTDLMVTHGASQKATVLYGSGNGFFNTTLSIDLPHSADFTALGDINSDGQIDFVTLDPNRPSAMIWLGD
jgi:hypothetical protein